jgi:TldD protein
VSPVEQYPDEVGTADKVALLVRVDDAARSANGAIVQVSAGYADSRKRFLVANTDGVLVHDEQVRTLLRVTAVADGDTGMQTGYDSMGHTGGFELFTKVDVDELARNAARIAVTKLNARPAPSGALPVVIQKGTPASTTCSSRTVCSPTTCGTSCGPARRVVHRAATVAVRATRTCRWCA